MSDSDEDGDVNEDSIISSENFADDDAMVNGDLDVDNQGRRRFNNRRRGQVAGMSDDEDVHNLVDDPMDDEDDEDDDGEHEEDEDGLETQDSVQNMVPIEFAKAHIAKIEDDMKHMHERHVKLMREMDQNYKMIEKETQEYYVEFLQKWREVAKGKITQYRR